MPLAGHIGFGLATGQRYLECREPDLLGPGVMVLQNKTGYLFQNETLAVGSPCLGIPGKATGDGDLFVRSKQKAKLRAIRFIPVMTAKGVAVDALCLPGFV